VFERLSWLEDTNVGAWIIVMAHAFLLGPKPQNPPGTTTTTTTT
jgi:hypothetical protein